MKRLQSVLCASALAIALSPTVLAGNIHSVSVTANGNIHSVSVTTNGNIHSVTGRIYNSILGLLTAMAL